MEFLTYRLLWVLAVFHEKLKFLRKGKSLWLGGLDFNQRLNVELRTEGSFMFWPSRAEVQGVNKDYASWNTALETSERFDSPDNVFCLLSWLATSSVTARWRSRGNSSCCSRLPARLCVCGTMLGKRHLETNSKRKSTFTVLFNKSSSSGMPK